MNIDRLLRNRFSIEECLDGKRSGSFERDIRKHRNVVSVTLGFNPKRRRPAGNHLAAIRRKDPYPGFKIADSDPMVHYGQTQKYGGKRGEKEILINAHQRQLIAHFNPYVVANDAVYQLR